MGLICRPPSAYNRVWPVTRTVRIEDTHGKVHAIEVTVH